MIINQATDLGEEVLKKNLQYKGFMGISIRHMFFSRHTMLQYFLWISQHFNDFRIILMDDPDKYNLMVFKGLNEADALAKAYEISENIKKGYLRILEHYKITNIKILQFKEFSLEPDYLRILKLVQEYMLVDSKFKDELLVLMEKNIGDRIESFSKEQNLSSDQLTNIKNILSQYIIEEIAFIIYMTENGFPIEIDPTTEFSTKKMLYENVFPVLAEKIHLSRRGHIYIFPEGTQYK